MPGLGNKGDYHYEDVYKGNVVPGPNFQAQSTDNAHPSDFWQSKWIDPLGGFSIFERKKPGANTVTTSQDAWWGLQPHLTNYYGALENWYNSPQQSASINPEMQNAWDMASARSFGSPIDLASQYAAYDTMGGLTPESFGAQFNPQAEKLGQQFSDILMPGISSKFIASGRTGSGAEQTAYGQGATALGESLSGLASNIYKSDRENQMRAIAQVPGLAEQDYANIDLLGQVGSDKYNINQQSLNAPVEKLGQWGSLLQPGLGFSTNSQTSPLYSNTAGSTLGGAAAGYGVGSQYGYGGAGALTGALLGYLSNK